MLRYILVRASRRLHTYQGEILTLRRYGRTSHAPLPNVLLRPLQPSRHSRHANPRPRCMFPLPPSPILIRSSNTHPQTTGTLLWQITNQSLNVAINNANANKSTPLSTSKIVQSYLLAVGASCSVALGLNALVPRLKRVSPGTKMVLGRLVPFAAVASAGALNVFLMRGEEIRQGIDVYPALSAEEQAAGKSEADLPSLGKSRKAATIAVSETAFSRVLNSSPVMVIPALALVRLQKMAWLKNNPRLVLPVNLGLILTTSLAALPFALGAFPQRERVRDSSLEPEFHGRGGSGGMVVFNRGI